jgi:hypothetical protein
VFFACLGLIQLNCNKTDNLPEKIGLRIDSVSINCDTIFIRSRINILSKLITEHGYCWTEYPEIPRLDNSKYTCKGPLINSDYFEEKIVPGKGNYFIRAYLINDSQIEYSDFKHIKIPVNE